jgi:hypothetical protein
VARSVGLDSGQGARNCALPRNGDLVSIEQAVSNVINNFVAYNQDSGHVAVLLERKCYGTASMPRHPQGIADRRSLALHEQVAQRLLRWTRPRHERATRCLP